MIDYAANTGHGTENIFYNTPDVPCIDIHQDPLDLYHGKDFAEQVSRGKGHGYTINILLPPHTSDDGYLRALSEIVVPIVKEYRPGLMVVVGLKGEQLVRYYGYYSKVAMWKT